MTCINAAQPLANYVIDYKLCQHQPIKPSCLQCCWQSTCQLLSWKCKSYKVIALTGERRDLCFESQSGFIRNSRSRYSKGHALSPKDVSKGEHTSHRKHKAWDVCVVREKDQGNGFFQGFGFLYWGFLTQRVIGPTSQGQSLSIEENKLKINNKFNNSSWDQEVILEVRLTRVKKTEAPPPLPMHLQVPTTPPPVSNSPHHPYEIPPPPLLQGFPFQLQWRVASPSAAMVIY